MRHCLDESCFETLSVHDVHDRLFTIPPLAIKCEMARICHFSSISYYEIQNFLTRQLKENNFVFNGLSLDNIIIIIFLNFIAF